MSGIVLAAAFAGCNAVLSWTSGVDDSMANDTDAGSNNTKGCAEKVAGAVQDGIALTVIVDSPTPRPKDTFSNAHGAKPDCQCSVTPEQECLCAHLCPSAVQISTCEMLLGPCVCKRSEESDVCECSGYCHTINDRQQSCENEPGCAWSGRWCEAQLGFVWG